MKRRNPAASSLSDPKFRPKVIPDKKKNPTPKNYDVLVDEDWRWKIGRTDKSTEDS